ncbi:right-handed parallel beta-helix repeat-containing protein [Streptomyces sp. NPDC127084]|uniref:right-handed parallel beta-helix repeat-containing protein n=1 Tax=Streptomyces sp. NPDC127084 TaxID=3347133 RepID=UPI00364977F4
MAGFVTLVGATSVSVAGAGAAEAQTPSPAPKAEGAKGGKGGEGGEKSASSKGDKGGKGGKESKGDKGGHEKRGQGDEGYGGRKRGGYGDDDKEYVECDPNALVAALVKLNEDRGGSLVLAKDCTYTLTANLDGSGLPQITQPISIFGHGATIERAANAEQFRLFDVGPGGDLKLRRLTLTRGKSAADEDGGALRVSPAGRLELNDVKVTDNAVDDIGADDGGGLLNSGIATVRRSVFHRNAAQDGAAVRNEGRIEIEDSEITGNTADLDTGRSALYNVEVMKVRRSTVSDNSAEDGAGAYADNGVLEVEESTFAHNFAAATGGGLQGDGDSLYVRDSLVEGNTAGGSGGGIDLTGAASIVGTKIVGNAVTESDATGGGVNASLDSDELVASIRDTQIIDNQAPGNDARGGGLFNRGASIARLTDVKVIGNISDAEAGGVHNDGEITTYGKIKIIDNVPTNCEGSANPVPNCFG